MWTVFNYLELLYNTEDAGARIIINNNRRALSKNGPLVFCKQKKQKEPINQGDVFAESPSIIVVVL